MTFDQFYDALDVVLQRKGIVETEVQSKTRLVSELREYYKDGAAVATAMKQEPVIVFDVSEFEKIKTQLIERAKKTQPVGE